MNAGRLHERIWFQTKRETGRDALNAKVFDWVNEVEVWAAVENLTGRESYAANQIQNPVTLRVLIRVGPSVQTSWRIRWWDQTVKLYRILTIDAILPSTTRDSLTLLCSEGTSLD